MFKWVCLGCAVIFGGGLGWAVNDIRRDVKRSVATINGHLPEILAKTEKSAATLAVLSEDIRQLRDLAGAADTARDRTLAAFADRLLDRIQSSGATIGLDKALGKGLKDTLPAREWTAAARKEALWLTFRAKSRPELIQRLTQNKFGSEWMIQEGDAVPRRLADWLGERDEEARAALEEQKAQ